MAAPKLGEVLVQAGACTVRDVEDALQNQVILGGTIGTNLLEVGAVTEEQLAAALSRVHGLPSLHGEIAVDPEAARLVTRELVERTEVVPLRLEGRRLVVLVANPAALQAFDEVAFATGKQLVPYVAAEVRVWGLMRQVYGIDRQLRAIELEPEALRTPPRGPAPAAEPKPTPGAQGDLMSEEAFEEIYERKAVVPEAEPPPIEEDLPEIDVIEEVVEPAAQEPTEPIVEPPPLTFAEASSLLASVGERKAIAQTVLRYARSKFKRAVLLTIHGPMARGWEGLGEGLTPQRIHGLQVKLEEPSVFETVVAARAHYLGAMFKTDQNLRYLKALGGGAPRTVFVMPILTLGKVVNVLYADDGRGAFVNPDVGELLILAAKISQSYDALLARRGPKT